MTRYYLLLSLALGSAACGSSIMFEDGAGGAGGTSGSVTGSGATGTTVGVGPSTGTTTVTTTTTGPGTTTTGPTSASSTTSTTVATTSGTGGMTSSTVTTTSTGTGGNPNCPHDVCTDGPALLPSCGNCEAAVCMQDPFCCQAWWDSLCIQEANQLCMANCPYCPHDMCDTGPALSPACDPCIAQVCAANPNCCSSWWGGGCIQLVGTICNIACP